MSSTPPPTPKWKPSPDNPGDPGPPTFRSGAYVHVEKRKPHFCKPPGWWRRWRDGVAPGTVWQCSCGQKHVLKYDPEGSDWWWRAPDE